ncbi:MAG TPA: S-methyl-5'-thioadenosine phosphorylase [Thermodesulfovibrionales bacterium]|nr:S-methyl-5'-thioadenosine phosphorylase [Thermodesulfovibrionales bacterium]
MPDIGVIAGSGIYNIPDFEITGSVKVSTPFGEPSDIYRTGRFAGKEIVFLPRHGSMHHIPPHRINYRANMWGFRELGVSRLLSVGATGGITGRMLPGSIVVLDQIIDMTSGRKSTFYDEDEVVHIDFTEPFCPDLRRELAEAAENAGIGVVEKGTYIAVNGPRLETAAEIRAYAGLGADVVGMTGMPEAVLARELEICFGGLAIVTNAAAGISEGKLTATEVVEAMQATTERIRILLKAFFSHEPVRQSACGCRSALKHARMQA